MSSKIDSIQYTVQLLFYSFLSAFLPLPCALCLVPCVRCNLGKWILFMLVIFHSQCHLLYRHQQSMNSNMRIKVVRFIFTIQKRNEISFQCDIPMTFFPLHGIRFCKEIGLYPFAYTFHGTSQQARHFLSLFKIYFLHWIPFYSLEWVCVNAKWTSEHTMTSINYNKILNFVADWSLRSKRKTTKILIGNGKQFNFSIKFSRRMRNFSKYLKYMVVRVCGQMSSIYKEQWFEKLVQIS